MIHRLETTTLLTVPIARAWEFFSDPRNLTKITPPELDFVVRTPPAAGIYPGMMIEYRVRPLLGIPALWLTEITQVAKELYFVDEQRVGPYRVWHHEHHFKPTDDGSTEMTDRVTYALPFGFLGNLVHPILVKPQLAKIFAFRERAVKELFG